MKANVLFDIGDIRYTEVPDPVPGVGEVLVNVSFAGICGSDISRIYQTGAHVMPLIPGHEFSGVVSEIGSEVETEWKGKRVGVFPLIPCGTCGPCRQRQYELCRHYNYLGSRCNGGFAEYVRVPVSNLIRIPEGVSMTTAAMLEPTCVAMHAIRRVIPDFGTEAFTPDAATRILVVGLGTIGLLLINLLQGVGYRKILAIGKTKFQREIARGLGIADRNIYTATPNKQQCDNVISDWLMSRTSAQGADVVFECVGKNETAVQAINAAAPLGRVVFVGNPYSDMKFPRDVYWKILRNQLTVAGTWNSSFTGEENDDWHCVLRLFASGILNPERLITQCFPMSELKKGLLIMRDKTEDHVKIMMKTARADLR